jgi:hypothetical protein
MTYWLIPPDGDFVRLGEREPSLAKLQQHVGGPIEYRDCLAGRLIVNEEGQLLDMPVNEIATGLANVVIVGTVVYCERGSEALGPLERLLARQRATRARRPS